MLYDYVLSNYHSGEPIFEVDIDIEGLPERRKREQLERLVAYNKLSKFMNGIYYIPESLDLADEKGISPDVVARNQYVLRRGKRIGYFGGYTLANLMGLSSQIPVREEYVSNAVGEKEKEVLLGTRTYIVRKPPVEVTEENYRVLQLLEILQDLEKYADDLQAAEFPLTYYIKRNHVSKRNVREYLEYFPVQADEYIHEMGLNNVFA